MNTNEPMTQEQLDAIRERLDNVEFPDNEHLTVMDGKESLVSWVERSHYDGSVVSGAVVATVHAGSRSAEMFAHAPQDLADLLAEVARLRARLTVDDAMMERATRAFGAATAQVSSVPLGMSEDTFMDSVGLQHLHAIRAALNAALGTGEGK